jgi:hypothetical protein
MCLLVLLFSRKERLWTHVVLKITDFVTIQEENVRWKTNTQKD